MIETYDMSWAEFKIRLSGLRRVREYEERLFREVAYQIFTLRYMFSKTNPPKIDRFWPIGGKPNVEVTDEQVKAFKKAYQEYKEKTNA